MALARWRTDFRRWEKEPGSPVCEVDLDVDRMLRARLLALIPNAGWLSEETADDPARLDRGLIWVVDPIDGTRGIMYDKRSAWILAGGAHHTCYSQNLSSEGLQDFAEMAGIEFVLIGKNTNLYQFKNELRWNDASFK